MFMHFYSFTYMYFTRKYEWFLHFHLSYFHVVTPGQCYNCDESLHLVCMTGAFPISCTYENLMIYDKYHSTLQFVNELCSRSSILENRLLIISSVFSIETVASLKVALWSYYNQPQFWACGRQNHPVKKEKGQLPSLCWAQDKLQAKFGDS